MPIATIQMACENLHNTSQLHRFNPSIPDRHIKYNEAVGTLFHCMWQCKEVQVFWKDVLTMEVTPQDPKLCLLHIYPVISMCVPKKCKLINFGLIQAKKVIAMKWKDVGRPTSALWVKEMSVNLVLEKLTYIIRGKTKDFFYLWSRFLQFVSVR